LTVAERLPLRGGREPFSMSARQHGSLWFLALACFGALGDLACSLGSPSASRTFWCLESAWKKQNLRATLLSTNFAIFLIVAGGSCKST